MNNLATLKLINESHVESMAERWLEDARWAPSGGNAQPWMVRVQETQTQVAFELSINTSYKEKPSLMDVNGVASVIALAAFGANLEILAAEDGFRLIQQEFNVKHDFWNSSVKLLFKLDLTVVASFSHLDILERCTDREFFSQDRLNPQFHKKLTIILDQYPMILKRNWSEDRFDLIEPLKKIELVRWQNKSFLKSLVSEISFGSAIKISEQQIPANQLGINLMDQFMLRLIKKYPSLGFAFKLGFGKIPSHKSIAPGIVNSESVYFLQITNESFENFYLLGKCFQHLWLTCAQEHVSFQPIANPFIAYAYLNHFSGYTWSRTDQKYLESAATLFKEKLGLNLSHFTFGFRIGKSLYKPTRTPRKKITVQVVNDLF